MRISKEKIENFHEFIFSWWKTHKRDLPWRHTHDPYKILVSEIMLQQTQVARGLPKYIEFVKKYPTVDALAGARPSEVLRLWKGMGYNRRALYLHNAAKIIEEKYHGVFPVTEELLAKLPGVGRYTARAVLVFAYKHDVSMVDTNIRRILTHFYFSDKTPPSEKEISHLADIFVPKGKSWEWHQALMDFGVLELPRRIIVKPKKRTGAKPFTETNRFFRGRMMDFVREKNWKQDTLLELMVKTHGKDRVFMQQILEGLMHDGLISRAKTGIITLPE